ncbi:hypothetical protein PoB_004801500 [Plakobranchus ocellatus]|uniref:Uncharacterized protein n=1 Tax=Plakobranchus ocellatus TaxID=259542 RepID=A0AAV4BQX9_9GAST|nr:hypothetical protein PoB_004801500 [Plakobranchus ocellatus]
MSYLFNNILHHIFLLLTIDLKIGIIPNDPCESPGLPGFPHQLEIVRSGLEHKIKSGSLPRASQLTGGQGVPGLLSKQARVLPYRETGMRGENLLAFSDVVKHRLEPSDTRLDTQSCPSLSSWILTTQLKCSLTPLDLGIHAQVTSYGWS